nr:amidase 1 [Ipomoea batatas]
MEKVSDDYGAFIDKFTLQPNSSSPQLPLHGLTFAIKDIFDVDGYVTGFGNPDWARTHSAATSTAPVILDLLKAGATGVGKTFMDEMAYREKCLLPPESTVVSLMRRSYQLFARLPRLSSPNAIRVHSQLHGHSTGCGFFPDFLPQFAIGLHRVWNSGACMCRCGAWVCDASSQVSAISPLCIGSNFEPDFEFWNVQNM